MASRELSLETIPGPEEAGVELNLPTGPDSPVLIDGSPGSTLVDTPVTPGPAAFVGFVAQRLRQYRSC